MERPFVDWIRVEDTRCVRRVELHLTPLHALIGPNDSGKSSILEAIRTGQNVVFWSTETGAAWSTAGTMPGRYPDIRTGELPPGAAEAAEAAVASRALVRFDPDELRAPTELIPHHQPLWFQTDKGRGLASLYDALLNRDRKAFARIDELFCRLFPTVKALRLENQNASTKSLGLTLVGGTEVRPHAMSEGMLYWLAFAIIEHLAPQSILLVEEPENGLHPARIREVMRVLREVSQRTQIILATHSPLVINELQPEEVTIITRTAKDGTIATPMTATKNFAERSKVYALGELWLSYADGDLERGLVEPSSEAAKAG